MAFSNRVRLPARLLKPQFPDTRTSFRDAAGNEITLSSVISKTYEFSTDYIPEEWLEKIAIIWGHDNIMFEGDKYFGGVSKNGSYDIAWLENQPNYPLATAKVVVNVTPFDASNSNCVTCDELSQVVLVDNSFPYLLNEGSTDVLDAIANDSVCCYPVVFTITSFNSDYLSSASIDSMGIVTVVVKTGLVAINGLNLLTYRATCANGGYDEADIFANINGTVPGCLAPTDLIGTGTTNTSIHWAWTAPSPAPDHYYWQVLSATNVLLQSGTTNALFIDIAGLTANTAYKFQVRSQCTGPLSNIDDATASNWIEEDFMTTPVAENTCGSYRVFPAAGGDPAPPHQGVITYLGCGGFYQTAHSDLFTPINICALQSAPGAPVDIHSTFTGITIAYLGLCGG